MPTDPASIPQHVVDESMHHYRPPGVSMEAHRKNMRRSIAAALDALFTEEPIVFIRTYRIPLTIAPGDTVDVYVKPSDVLAAVLARLPESDPASG